MSRLVPVMVLLAIASAVASANRSVSARAVAEQQAEGRDPETAFADNNCSRCHSVGLLDIEATAPERMQGPDLSEVASRHEVDWIVAYLKREVELDGKAHGMPFRGDDDTLLAIATWLHGLQD